MNISHNIVFQFYQNLGKLFYAIAAIDNTIRDEEFNTLQNLVNKHWLNNNLIGENSVKDVETIILDTFKWLREDNEYNAEACYNSFIRFKKQNDTLFTDQINSLILKTAGIISASFSNQNKSELILLAKLNLDLKKTAHKSNLINNNRS